MSAGSGAANFAVQLWEVSDAPACPVALDATEQARAARMTNAEARRMFVACRSALRVLLGRALGVDPLSVPVVTESGGKPALATGHALAFSVSHAGDVGLIALSHHARVGVDVERVPQDIHALSAIETVLVQGERDDLHQCPRPLRPAWLTAAWTRREALLKGRGTGLSDEALRQEPGADPSWTIRDVEVRPGYRAALAIERAGWTGVVTREQYRS